MHSLQRKQTFLSSPLSGDKKNSENISELQLRTGRHQIFVKYYTVRQAYAREIYVKAEGGPTYMTDSTIR